ncbi:unnamed protein product [Pseudo-nitzschia multistriata]|uniref:Uncharacterized protein n=1 Tax=Pseudo-nitzschia multistriata TaxID=183589 RepID=A0A448YXC2_9STRA|nr:unnamed protein product [Pseudo-nitzschia multistriata]
MTSQRNSMLRGLLLLVLCTTTASGFQKSALSSRSPTFAQPAKSNGQSVVLFLNTPPNYDDNDFDATPSGGFDQQQDLPAQSIPKLKIPKPSLSVPEIDFKETLKKIAVLAVTVGAFIAIQKGGMILAETFTPELSEEQVRNFVL